jgi:methylenetetrahydrofolate reductase (NADPH)
MKIASLFRQGRPVLSFEVFPPKRDGDDVQALYKVLEQLQPLRPDYVSVTYGAGGGNKGLAFQISAYLLKIGLTPLAHFTCVGHDKAAVGEQLDELWGLGVRNILALRGDPPQGQTQFIPPKDGFAHANELVAFIKARHDFCVGVAAFPETHPDAVSAETDLRYLKQKLDAGADFANTQMFFDNAAYFRLLERARALGISQPIVPGIMPVLTPKFFAREWGVAIPERLRSGLGLQPGPEGASFGLQFCVEQCQQLLEGGAPGIHLYTMNKAETAAKVWAALGPLQERA